MGDNVQTANMETTERATTLSADDIDAITELINNESTSTGAFNTTGIIVGATLLGSGIILSGISVYLSSQREYKQRDIIKYVCTLAAIPLTTSGLIMTTFFALHNNKTVNGT